MKHLRIEAAILAAGLLLLGICLYLGVTNLTDSRRVVNVHGVSEREVKADHVIWPIVYKTTGNDLQALYEELRVKNEKIKQFLVQNGISEKEITVSAPQTIDLLAERYTNPAEAAGRRYNVTAVTTVATGNVEKVEALINRVGELLQQGIAISAGDWQNEVKYEFNALETIKPAMIEEATKDARRAAEQFGKDSGSEIGKIQHADQGYFSIEDRDKYTPSIKTVRVVTNVTFYLDN